MNAVNTTGAARTSAGPPPAPTALPRRPSSANPNTDTLATRSSRELELARLNTPRQDTQQRLAESAQAKVAASLPTISAQLAELSDALLIMMAQDNGDKNVQASTQESELRVKQKQQDAERAAATKKLKEALNKLRESSFWSKIATFFSTIGAIAGAVASAVAGGPLGWIGAGLLIASVITQQSGCSPYLTMALAGAGALMGGIGAFCNFGMAFGGTAGSLVSTIGTGVAVDAAVGTGVSTYNASKASADSQELKADAQDKKTDVQRMETEKKDSVEELKRLRKLINTSNERTLKLLVGEHEAKMATLARIPA